MYLYLRCKSGWGCDHVSNRPIAPDELAWLEVGEAYCKYSSRPFLYFEEISYLIGKGTATGRYASSSRAPMATHNTEEEQFMVGQEGIQITSMWARCPPLLLLARLHRDHPDLSARRVEMGSKLYRTWRL